MTNDSPRKEKKSETLELRISWSEKQAFMAKCEADGIGASARLRDLIEHHLSDPAEHTEPQPERKISMSPVFRKRPRAGLAAIVAIAGTSMLAAATPSMANIDTEAVFNLMDSNRDGRVVFEEYYELAAQEGFFMTPDAPVDAPERLATEAEIIGGLRSDFARYDRNRDGALTHAEFASRYIWRMETTFNAIDRDGDGKIEARELARVMGSIGLDGSHAHLSRQGRAEQAIRALDKNDDGALDFEEYTSI